MPNHTQDDPAHPDPRLIVGVAEEELWPRPTAPPTPGARVVNRGKEMDTNGEPSTSMEGEGGLEEEGKEAEREGISPKTLQLEIDHILEETARRKNLSVMNVKSILRVS